MSSNDVGWKAAVAAIDGRYAIDFARAIINLTGSSRSPVEWREALVEHLDNGYAAVDWREALLAAFPDHSWREAIILAVQGGGEPSFTIRANLDFVNGVYSAGGSSQNIADLLGDDAEPASTFDQADIVPGNGLKGSVNGGTSLPSLIGPLLADYLGTAGSTILIEFFVDDSQNSGQFAIDAFNSPVWDTDVAAGLSIQNGNFFYDIQFGVPGDPTDTDIQATAYSSGVHKLAMTVAPNEMSFSIDGATVSTVVPTTPPTWGSLTKAYFTSFDAAYIRSVKIYDPAAASDLHFLSAVQGGGGDDLPSPPSGFAYLVNGDGSYIVNTDGAFILAKV